MSKKKRIQWVAMLSTDSHIVLFFFLKATCFYQVGDHLICIRAVIICVTLRDQMVIKNCGRHLEFLRFPAWLWTMHTRGDLKDKPPTLSFHNFRHSIYLPNPSTTGRMRHKVNFWSRIQILTFPKESPWCSS